MLDPSCGIRLHLKCNALFILTFTPMHSFYILVPKFWSAQHQQWFCVLSLTWWDSPQSFQRRHLTSTDPTSARYAVAGKRLHFTAKLLTAVASPTDWLHYSTENVIINASIIGNSTNSSLLEGGLDIWWCIIGNMHLMVMYYWNIFLSLSSAVCSAPEQQGQ